MTKILFKHQILILGFGSLGRAILPLLFKTFSIHSTQVTIISNDDSGQTIANEFNIPLHVEIVTQHNYLQIIGSRISPNDLLINLSVNISSLALIALCQNKKTLYLDMSTEPWQGGYTNKLLSPELRANYTLRERVLKLKSKKSSKGPTALITHGANPGLISHFLKQALLNIANDTGVTYTFPKTAKEWAKLSKTLGIKTIHIAERDTQVSQYPKKENVFINTWSVDGLISESCQPAELGWGTHEQHFPQDAQFFPKKNSIYINRPSASVHIRTWTPSNGPFHGLLISHAEAISITDFLTCKDANGLYRPTVHYAYQPCPDAVRSIAELRSSEWSLQPNKHILLNDITQGFDELGILLMGNPKGAYWYGSKLSIEETRQIAPHNNATSMQVIAGAISGIAWMLENTDQGLVEPEEIDHEFILKHAQIYLGEVKGYYTDWTPLQNRASLFTENLDWSDPWQFSNIRVE